mmetsp:Transcript_33681/g.78812  ORF Transcript_33681/g.78812 Transcript_33681/m.78812 type:complete len:102 (-) Transcript_33681:63-368(-)
MWLSTSEEGDTAGTRTYEVLVSGRALLLCDRNPAAYAPLGIVDGKHAVFFNTTEELVRLARFYSEHEGRRKRIVENARQLALTRHLWKHRAVQMQQIVQTM